MKLIFVFTVASCLFQSQEVFSSIEKTFDLPEIGGYYIPSEIAGYVFDILIDGIKNARQKNDLINKPYDFYAALSMRSISQGWNTSLFSSLAFQECFDRAVIFNIKYELPRPLFLSDSLYRRYRDRYDYFVLPYGIYANFFHCEPGIATLYEQIKKRRNLVLCISFPSGCKIGTFCKDVKDRIIPLLYRGKGCVKHMPIKIVFEGVWKPSSISRVYQQFIESSVFPRVLTLPISWSNPKRPEKVNTYSQFSQFFDRLFSFRNDELKYVFCSYDNAPFFVQCVPKIYRQYVRYYNTNFSRTAKKTLLNPTLQWTMDEISIIAREAANNGDSSLFLATFLYCIRRNLILDLDFSQDIIGMFIRCGINIHLNLLHGDHIITECSSCPKLVQNLLEYGLKIDQKTVNGTEFTLLEYVLDKAASIRNPFKSIFFQYIISTVNLLLAHDAPYSQSKLCNYSEKIFRCYNAFLKTKKCCDFKKNKSLFGLSLYNKMLFKIVQFGHTYLLQLALLSGADINQRNKYKRTIAYYVKSAANLDYLLRHGLKIHKHEKNRLRKFLKKKNIKTELKEQLIQFINGLF
jgi:hypothetical protein